MKQIKKEKLDEVVTDILNYYAGLDRLSESYSEEQKEVIARKEKEWNSLPCDPEGASEEQVAEQDKFLQELAKEVLKSRGSNKA